MSFLLQVATGVLGFFLADRFIEGVMAQDITVIIYAGVILGVLNFFIKPILQILTLPLHVLTLGVSALLINAAVVWLVQASFAEMTIDGFLPLIYTTLVIWIAGVIVRTLSG